LCVCVVFVSGQARGGVPTAAYSCILQAWAHHRMRRRLFVRCCSRPRFYFIDRDTCLCSRALDSLISCQCLCFLTCLVCLHDSRTSRLRSLRTGSTSACRHLLSRGGAGSGPSSCPSSRQCTGGGRVKRTLAAFCVPLYPTLRVQILRHEGVCSCAIVLLVVLLQPEPAPVPAPPAAPAVDPALEAELAAKLAQVKALEGKVADVKNTVLKVPPHTCACDACSVWCSGGG
jgi:hypothetical protein